MSLSTTSVNLFSGLQTTVENSLFTNTSLYDFYGALGGNVSTTGIGNGRLQDDSWTSSPTTSSSGLVFPDPGDEESGGMAPVIPDVANTIWRYTGLISLSDFRKIRIVLRLYVSVALCVFGVLSNIASFVVIHRDGLRKSSNILLMALAMADLMVTGCKTNISENIYFFSGTIGFHFSPGVNIFLFYLYQVNNYLSLVAYFCSVTLPLLITGERIVAIFFPLKFTRIVTRSRTIKACVLVFSCYVIRLVPVFWDLRSSNNNGTMYMFYQHGITRTPVYITINLVSNYITGLGFLGTVIIGTVVIGIKVRLISEQRKKLSSGGGVADGKSTSRTTKTLLSVCAVYCFTNLAIFIVDTIRGDGYLTNDLLMYEISEIFGIINSSCNFFIYIFINKKFVLHMSFRKSKVVRH